MYKVFLDEAGTSLPEPVTVVAGVILESPYELHSATSLLSEIVARQVPSALRKSFWFHAKDLISGRGEIRAHMSLEHRMALIADIASIPRRVGAAIALGRVRRDSDVPESQRHDIARFHHASAFWGCVARANKYIRDWDPSGEAALLVAEATPKRNGLLRRMLGVPEVRFHLDERHLALTLRDRLLGVQQTNMGPIDRVNSSVRFLSKNSEPILQIADACAFSFRRYFADQPAGAELLQSMLGNRLTWGEWQGPSSQFTFSFGSSRMYGDRHMSYINYSTPLRLFVAESA